MSKNLILIPARGGSKGVPGKNIKLLGGKPLIFYTLDAACKVDLDKVICVSTDSDEIIENVKEYGLNMPFKRPSSLATDMAGMYEVILHAIEFYEKANLYFEKVILLQPTSPLRTARHISEALSLYNSNIDMVVSVKKAKANPYYTLFEENDFGYLTPSKRGNFARRQDCPDVYEYNGAIYIMNCQSLRKKPPSEFKRIQKYLMSEEDSVDVDTPMDFLIAQTIMEQYRPR